MTWRELFARLWLFLRAHLRRQHMCPECGDAQESYYLPCGLGRSWRCEVCEEERRLKREALAELTKNDPMPYVPQPELNQYEPGTLLWANEVFKDLYKTIYMLD